MQAFTTGFNNSNAYFKYNYKKSEFSIYYNFSYRATTSARWTAKTHISFLTERSANANI